MTILYRTVFRFFTIAAVGCFLSACGGSDSPALQPPQPPPTGGIEGSGIAVGTITGFGSIFVNGIEFSTSGASITVEDQPATESQLKVGQVVLVEGSIDDNGVTGSADRVVYDDVIEGPIGSIDLAAGSLVVLGQTVQTDGDTSFDDRIVPASLDGLSVGAIVEVSGFVDAAGVIRATRIEPDDDGDEFEIEGVAGSVDSAAMTFMIGGLTVDYSAAVLENFPGGNPENGQRVEAHGTGFGSNDELLATRVEFEDGEFDLGENDEVEIEGIVTRFASASDFDVSGQAVSTNGQTQFENGTAANLAENIKLEAEGTVNSAGVLVAEKIEFRGASSVEIEASVDSVDADAGTVVLMGITVTVDVLTRMEDKSDAEIERFSLSDVNPGNYLAIRGGEQPPGSNMVLASRLEREDVDTEVLLQGAVSSISLPDDFIILGVTIRTGAGTQFRDGDTPISKAQFFAAADGRLVKAKGSWDGLVLQADEAEFED